jgi:hypothetical protein
MHIYISGPMRDKPLYNFPAFFKAAMTLRSLGHVVYNPAEWDMAHGFDPSKSLKDNGFMLGDAMTRDFKQILGASAIVMLDGWEESRGANAELLVATHCGKHVYAYDELSGGLIPLEVPEPDINWNWPRDFELPKDKVWSDEA